jgi:hypothetical protein
MKHGSDSNFNPNGQGVAMSAHDVIAQIKDDLAATRFVDLDVFAGIVLSASDHKLIVESADFTVAEFVTQDGVRFLAIQGALRGDVCLIRQTMPAVG